MQRLRGKINGRGTNGPVGRRRGDAREALRCRGVGGGAAAFGAGAVRMGAGGCGGAGIGGGWGVRGLRRAVEVFGLHGSEFWRWKTEEKGKQ